MPLTRAGTPLFERLCPDVCRPEERRTGSSFVRHCRRCISLHDKRKPQPNNHCFWREVHLAASSRLRDRSDQLMCTVVPARQCQLNTSCDTLQLSTTPTAQANGKPPKTTRACQRWSTKSLPPTLSWKPSVTPRRLGTTTLPDLENTLRWISFFERSRQNARLTDWPCPDPLRYDPHHHRRSHAHLSLRTI